MQETNPYTGEIGMPHGYVDRDGFGDYVPPAEQQAPSPVDMIALRKWALEQASLHVNRVNRGDVDAHVDGARKFLQFALTGKPD